MAVPARFEMIDHEARLRSGDLADSPYGSLLGGGPRVVKKKRPVLMLAAEELEQAHQAIAMGGAQIMDEADDPVAESRPRMPAMLLGLAPLGADEDWQPPVAAAFNDPLDEDWAEAAALEGAPEPEPDPETAWEEAEDMAEDPAPLPTLPEAVFQAPPAYSLDDSEAWEASVPSIEEQLLRMRHLTRPQVVPPVEQDIAPEPEALPELMPEPLPEPLPELAAMPEPEPVAAIEPLGEPEPDLASQFEEPVFDLPIAAVAPELEPEPEAESQPDLFADDFADDGPDLSWMMPKERRQLQFSESDHSFLRARLVHADSAEPTAPPSLWDRLRDWVARLFG